MPPAVRRLAGGVLLLGGIGLLGAVGWRYADGALARDRARAEWAAMEARWAVESAQERAERPQGPVAPGTPVARVVIPRIGLDEVILEGVEATVLNAAPGHMPGTPMPGATGNSVISAHRDRHFHRLGQLAVGDTVRTFTPQGHRTWRITGRRIVGAGRPVLYDTPTAILTLTTCWPIRFIGPAPDRLLLVAEPVGS